MIKLEKYSFIVLQGNALDSLLNKIMYSIENETILLNGIKNNSRNEIIINFEINDFKILFNTNLKMLIVNIDFLDNIDFQLNLEKDYTEEYQAIFEKVLIKINEKIQ